MLKLKITISLSLLLIASMLMLGAREDAGPGPDKRTYLKFTIPAGWPKPANDIFANNKLTEQGFQLGRKLFYDGRLSKDGNFPCASCHQQFAAFASYEHDLSHGFDNKFTTRNAPALFNLAWMPLLHWDGGVNHIEVQPLGPITAPNEMGENMDSVLAKIRKDTAYKRMFKAAFNDNLINSQHLLKALAQFTGSLVSFNSRYDKVMRGETVFNNVEKAGYEFFKLKCSNCHPEPLFTDFSFRNTGFPLSDQLKDIGRMKITGNPGDSLKFKVPSLRNIALTFPYIHDGRTYAIGQVLDHYRNGITQSPTLDSSLRKGIPMTKYEKNNLVYFLYSLTDSSLISNPRFSMPANVPVFIQKH
jgi:cytochrome c peroxidase